MSEDREMVTGLQTSTKTGVESSALLAGQGLGSRLGLGSGAGEGFGEVMEKAAGGEGGRGMRHEGKWRRRRRPGWCRRR